LNAPRTLAVIAFALLVHGCAGEGLDLESADETNSSAEAVIEGCTLYAQVPARWISDPNTVLANGGVQCNHPVDGYFVKVCLQIQRADGWHDLLCEHSTAPSFNNRWWGESAYTQGLSGRHSYRTRVYATNSATSARRVSDAAELGF
jgi:hypothetical protein